MEARVTKMESELRVLRAAIAEVPQNILRELTARGALLVVQAPAVELEDVVTKGANVGALEENVPAVVEEEEEEEGEEEREEEDKDPASGGDDEEEKVAIAELNEDMEVEEAEKKEEDEEEKAWGCEDVETAADNHVVNALVYEKDESSESEDDDSDDSSGSEEEEEEEAAAPPVQVDQREEVETSQESAASGPVAEQSPLSLTAFDKAIAQPTPAPTTTAVPSRPPVPFALSVASAPIRPLVLARRSATAESRELPPPAATPTPVPAFMPVPAKNRAVILNLPAHFEVQTKDSVPVAWEKWCCGDTYNGFPPLRLVTSKHVVNKAVLRRLSDLRCAMLPIETLAKQNELWSESLSPHEAASVFQQLAPMLPLSQALPSGRERKKEITWSTALNIMRRGKKRKQPQTNDGYISETLI